MQHGEFKKTQSGKKFERTKVWTQMFLKADSLDIGNLERKKVLTAAILSTLKSGHTQL